MTFGVFRPSQGWWPVAWVTTALFAGAFALGQLWLFIVAPVVGALIAGATYALLFGDRDTAPVGAATQP